MASLNEISVSQLARLIGTPSCPVVFDLRLDEDFEDDQRLLPGAIRCRHDNLEDMVDRADASNVVVYCWKGLKISQGAAALLRLRGVKSDVLEGGFVAWKEARLPLIPADKLPPIATSGQRLWVTRHRPKIDRIACPWLIRRFVDPNAGFLFVSPSQVHNVADRFDATPFDMKDVFWSHREDRCTFDTMIEEFGLTFNALEQLAEVVRAADTDRHDLAPQAAGLLAVSVGLSRMYRCDLQQLEAGMLIYDALYRWARDATDEKHSWPNMHGGGRSDA